MEYIIKNKKQEAEGIVSLFLKRSDGQKLDYKAGQYLVAKPLGSELRSKAFTISSSPKEDLVCLTIKVKSGTSLALTKLNLGDKIVANGPFGHFYPENNSDELVMIAGGIGVTPFYSVIKDRLQNKQSGKMTLFYSNKTSVETAFAQELNKISTENTDFKVVHNLTQEKPNDETRELGRLSINSVKKHLGDLKNKQYYLCGSIQFVNDIWKMLKEVGVEESVIFTEAMF